MQIIEERVTSFVEEGRAGQEGEFAGVLTGRRDSNCSTPVEVSMTEFKRKALHLISIKPGSIVDNIKTNG